MPTDSVTLAQRVVREVARAEGVPPSALDPPLYEVIDPDALDDLFASTRDDSDPTVDRVVFEYLTYEVAVTADGEVRLRCHSDRTAI